MAANYVLIQETTLNASAASVTFSSIPQTGYTDLVIKASVRTDASRASNGMLFDVRPNGSSANLIRRSVYGESGAAASASGSDSYAVVTDTNDYTANTFSNAEIYIPNYTSSNYKSMSADSVTETNSSAGLQMLGAMLWSNTAAITSLQFTPLAGNFVAGSSFSLYGIAAVGTTPTVVPKASGGDIVVNDGTYWYHAFLASGTFVPQTTLSADVLVVAGGAGGGLYKGGGGGAGGLRIFSSQSLSATNHTCTIGAGGPKQTGSGTGVQTGSNGVSTTFGSLGSSTGGGVGAGGNSGNAPAIGGSGGGGGNGNAGAAGTVGQGNAGGTSTGQSGSGGGGAGGAGGAGGTTTGGTGGVGVSTYSSWLSATGLGVSGFITGGGGGGATNGAGGTGGSGGGGNGASSSSSNATDGVVNTGSGGGGGGGDGASPFTGGNGGSGIVIIRYSMS